MPLPLSDHDWILGKLKRRGPFRGYVEMGALTGTYRIRDMKSWKRERKHA